MNAQTSAALNRLAAAWPLGARVNHVSGWSGRIVDDPPRDMFDNVGVASTGAHALLTRPVGGSAKGAVRVARTVPGGGRVVGWFNPAFLRPGKKG